MYTRSARIDAMIETYREGAADKKCGKCGKGKAKCSKCSHEKAESMKEDGLSADEYLAACELRIQNQSRTYIRARLDAAGMRTKGKGVKCGNSYISQGEKCGSDGPAPRILGKGKENVFNANNSIRGSAALGAKRNRGTSVVAGVLGAGLGYMASGGSIKGALAGGALNAAVPQVVGALVGGAATAGAKTVRAFNRRRKNVNKWAEGMEEVEAKYEKSMQNLGKKAKRLSPEKFREADERIANRFVKSADKVYNSTTTNVWSNANEPIKDKRKGWVKTK